MKKFFFFLLFTAQFHFAQIQFDDFLNNKLIRFDYYHAGDKSSVYFYFNQIGKELNLAEPLNLNSPVPTPDIKEFRDKISVFDGA